MAEQVIKLANQLCSFGPVRPSLQMKGRWESNLNVWFQFIYETVQPPYFQNRIIMFCLPISKFMYLWEIYIFPGLVCLFCCSQIEIGRPILGTYKSTTDRQIKELGTRPGHAVSFLGIYKSDFWYSASWSDHQSRRRTGKCANQSAGSFMSIQASLVGSPIRS